MQVTTSYPDADAESPAPVAQTPAALTPAVPPETLPAGAPAAYADPGPRPIVLAMRALGQLLERSSYLPDLAFSILPNGTILGQVETNVAPEVAARSFFAWREVLRSGAHYFSEVPRYDGAYEWAEIRGHLAVAPRDPHSPMMLIQIQGRRFASARLPYAVPDTRSGGTL